MMMVLLQRCRRELLFTYGKRKSTYAKWKTYFTFMQTTVYMKTVAGTIAFFFCCSGFAQDSMSIHYKIYDTRTKQSITIDKIVTDMADADVLFFGEEHNDSAAHYLENKIFRALHAQYGEKVVLSMEMFETDGQLVLNEYLAS